MSTSGKIPIIKLHGNLIVPIQIALNDELVLTLKDDIARQITVTECNGLIIDLSGVDVLDSFISRSICDIGVIADLMGVKTVICGLDPLIAMTLVEMDIDFPGIATKMDLEDALAHLAATSHGRTGRDDEDDIINFDL